MPFPYDEEKTLKFISVKQADNLKRRINGVLNPRQEAFARAMASMKYTQTDAAIAAGYTAARAATCGSRLMKSEAVKKRIAKLMKEAGHRNDVSIDEVIAGLRLARDEAFASGQYSAGIRATELLGKYLGIFSDKLSVTRSSAFSEADLDRITRVAGIKRGARVVGD